ncbi:hypothetical protein SAMN05192575_10888 [Nocardioides alpinus]|uniref:Uncharacterized protein n=1 Tax=Nocardioides alpinus TaxID=748909 RepID=A0A1I1AF53_9ACTN|nr:hypothetical protein [Nocardioides alpinus]PKH43463.1 hypothetical protein CXG46_03090 [Nocardioides alpinus]SFB35090.1 hypothetical protein SAMN05192575_10888 [Nocardioides alpinus]
MVRTGGELLAPVRAALTLLVVAIASMLAASVLAPQVSAESVLVIAALSTATTALVGSHRTLVLPTTRPLMLPARWAHEVLPHLAGRSTDVDHHPQRPRAPGLV